MHRRFHNAPRFSEKRFRVNMAIRVPQVAVIDSDGTNIGVITINEALQRANEQELDLIEVSPLATPPVCRIMDLGKWQYQQSQKIKKQKTPELKNIRLSFKIGDHDRQVKLDQTKKFLDKGHKVRIELRLKGREKAYPEQAREIIKAFVKELGTARLEQPVSSQSFTFSALITKN